MISYQCANACKKSLEMQKSSRFLVQDVQLNASKTLENQHSCPRTNSYKPITYETKLQENKDNFPSKNLGHKPIRL